MKLLLDANLAVLLVVGLADREFIRRHKRLRSYRPRDFDALTGFAGAFEVILFLPNVLTEVSNLVVYGVRDPLRGSIVSILKRVIAESAERYVASRTATIRKEFPRLGLTDAALLECGGADTLLLTDDRDLFAAACDAGIAVESFEQFRQDR